MATLMAASNHNFTAASWGTVDATSLLVSSTNNTTLTTAYVLSSTFTPGAITVDGIAVWVNTRLGSTGTISVALDVATVTVAGTEVTIDVADIPSDGNCWVFFKFPAPVLLLAATAYSVKAKTSSATQVNLFRNSTAGNWSRLLRTTTLAAPGAADTLYVIGEKTGAGTGNTITVTMDNTATTTWGLVDVSSGGILINGVAAATAYRLKLGGNLNIRSGGEVNIGTSGSRIPADSTAEWDFANSVNVDFGIVVTGNGRFETWGNHNDVPWALLAADASAGATSLTTDRETGWKNGDLIGLASTTRTAADSETKALGADASGTSLPTIAALGAAHGGNASTKVQGELINLTRNVKIHGTSTSLQSYIATSATSVVSLNDAEIYNMGSNTGGKRGINVSCTTGSFIASYCAFRDFVVTGAIALFLDASGVDNVTIEHCVSYNTSRSFISSSTSNGASVVISDCVGIREAVSTDALFLASWASQISDCRAAGATGAGFLVTGGTFNGIFANLVSHSNTNRCFQFDAFTEGSSASVTNLLGWRSGNAYGLEINSVTMPVVDGFEFFGSGVAGIDLNAFTRNGQFLNGIIRSGATLLQTEGVHVNTSVQQVFFVNCVFGGGGETHSDGDIRIASSNTTVGMLLDNCILNSPTQIFNQTNLLSNPFPVSTIRANFLGQTQDHKTWLGNGTWSYDTTAGLFVVSPSLRLTPTSATVKLQSPGFLVGVSTGQSVTASIKVRKSVIGDGAAYNGNQPRWIVRRNYGAGITSDTVLDTATAAADGAFETLTGVTAAVTGNCVLECYVDCDGTAGWVNCDDVTLIAA